MKKFFVYLILIIILLIPIIVLAEGNISVSPQSLNLEVGETKTFTISTENLIGQVYIYSQNKDIAITNTEIWSIVSEDNKPQNTKQITVTGLSAGKTYIDVQIETTNKEFLSETRTIEINVKSRTNPTPTPSNNTNNTNNNTNNNTTNTNTNNNVNNNTNNNVNNNVNNNTNNKVDNKSSNNKIKEIIIKDQEIKKIDDNNYEVIVVKRVSSIEISATPEDEKTTIDGLGEKTLELGENNFELVVSAEDGSQNKINIKVIREETLVLEDLLDVLNNENIDNINITIYKDTIIPKEYLEAIKNSKKIITFNYYIDRKLIYSFTIDGNNIDGIDDFIANIESINDKEFSKAANYADGLMIKVGSIIPGTKIKLYVGNKYEDDKILNIYSYNQEEDTINHDYSDILVEDGYVTFNLNENNEYLFTRSDINKKNMTKKRVDSLIILILSMIGVLIILFILVIHLVNKRKKNIPKESKEIVVNNDNLVINNDYTSEYLNDDSTNDFDDNINYNYTINKFNDIENLDEKSEDKEKQDNKKDKILENKKKKK